jgi:hypothetical protein
VTDTTAGAWDPALLARIAEIEEVVIETERASGATRRTIIWIVADRGRVYVRSVRGDDGWWYRDVQARPKAAIDLGDERVPVEPIPASDPETVQFVSALFEAKYGSTQRRSTDAMLRAHTLPTTLRLDPA